MRIEIRTDTIFIATVVNCSLSHRSLPRYITKLDNNGFFSLNLIVTHVGVITLDYILFVFDLSA